jgi:DNA-nicking Smr family endonuclease
VTSADGSEPEEPDDELPEEVVVPLEDSLDLHSFLPRDARSVVESYLEQAVEAGFDEVRLIHGRGIGVQRRIVRSLLEGHPAVSGFEDAPPERGGRGATIVRLRRL